MNPKRLARKHEMPSGLFSRGFYLFDRQTKGPILQKMVTENIRKMEHLFQWNKYTYGRNTNILFVFKNRSIRNLYFDKKRNIFITKHKLSRLSYLTIGCVSIPKGYYEHAIEALPQFILNKYIRSTIYEISLKSINHLQKLLQ